MRFPRLHIVCILHAEGLQKGTTLPCLLSPPTIDIVPPLNTRSAESLLHPRTEKRDSRWPKSERKQDRNNLHSKVGVAKDGSAAVENTIPNRLYFVPTLGLRSALHSPTPVHGQTYREQVNHYLSPRRQQPWDLDTDERPRLADTRSLFLIERRRTPTSCIAPTQSSSHHPHLHLHLYLHRLPHLSVRLSDMGIPCVHPRPMHPFCALPIAFMCFLRSSRLALL